MEKLGIYTKFGMALKALQRVGFKEDYIISIEATYWSDEVRVQVSEPGFLAAMALNGDGIDKIKDTVVQNNITWVHTAYRVPLLGVTILFTCVTRDDIFTTPQEDNHADDHRAAD